jgi:hypothetical protein
MCYPVARDGSVARFDDLPARYRANVDTTDRPLGAKRGERPIWNEHDISDVIAYLATLTDGYSREAHDGGVSPLTNRRADAVADRRAGGKILHAFTPIASPRATVDRL